MPEILVSDAPLEKKLAALASPLKLNRLIPPPFSDEEANAFRDASGRIDYDAIQHDYGWPAITPWETYGWLWTIKTSTSLSIREALYLESMIRDVPRAPPTDTWFLPHQERLLSIKRL